MKVGDLVRYKQFGRSATSIGVVTSFRKGFAMVHWLDDGEWCWEDTRDLQPVKKCP